MYAKVFRQIYDSSIAEDYMVRFIFMDLLVLADSDGVVDMTQEAISRRTNVPVKEIERAITALESPDLKSRTPSENGARLVRLDSHRDWGWIIVNYHTFRQIASEEQRKEKTRERVKRYRSKPVTLGNACNAREPLMEKEKEEGSTKLPKRVKTFNPFQTDLTQRFHAALNSEWENDRQKWMRRIKNNQFKVERVLVDMELAMREGKVKTSPAQYAEHRWKEFK